MHEIYELKERLCEELEEYNNKEMSKTNLEVVEKLSTTIKNLGKIIEMYEEEEGYSSRGGSYARDRRSYDGGYGGSYRGDSYARDGRGRGRNARRDAMGRYSRDEEMVHELRALMEDAPNEKTRREFERFISKIENM